MSLLSVKQVQKPKDFRAAMGVTNNSDQTFSLQARILGRDSVVIDNLSKSILKSDGPLKGFLNDLFTSSSGAFERKFVIQEDAVENLVTEFGFSNNQLDTNESNVVTFVAYGASFDLKDSSGDSHKSIKIRLSQKYNQKSEFERPDQMTSNHVGWSDLELKISNLKPTVGDQGSYFPIYRPKISIPDELLMKLQKLSKSQFSNLELLDSFVDELLSLSEAEGKNKDLSKEDLSGFFQVIFSLGKRNSKLLRLETVAAFRRERYSKSLSGNEALEDVELNVDRGLRVFDPNSDIPLSKLNVYASTEPAHQVPDEHVFIEVKSLLNQRSEDDIRSSSSADDFVENLSSLHVENYRADEDKLALSSSLRDNYELSAMSQQLRTEGLLYFLIKGTANLPSPPNRKKLVEGGELDIALPFIKNGEKHRLILHYLPLITDGQRSEILSGLSMVDHLGRPVSIGKSFSKELVNSALAGPDPISIALNGEEVMIPGVIGPEVSAQYNDFFARFYTNFSKREGNPREIESLNNVDSSKALLSYLKKMKRINFLSYLWSRLHRIGTQAVVTGAVLVALGSYANFKNVDSSTAAKFSDADQTQVVLENHNFQESELISVESQNGEAALTYRLIFDEEGKPILVPAINEQVASGN